MRSRKKGLAYHFNEDLMTTNKLDLENALSKLLGVLAEIALRNIRGLKKYQDAHLAS